MSGYTFTSSKPWHKCTRAQLLEGVEMAIEQRDKQIERADSNAERAQAAEAELAAARSENERLTRERDRYREAWLLRGRQMNGAAAKHHRLTRDLTAVLDELSRAVVVNESEAGVQAVYDTRLRALLGGVSS